MIYAFQAFQVIAFEKNGEQKVLCYAASLKALEKEYKKRLAFNAKQVAVCGLDVLASYKVIRLWNVETGFSELSFK
ncbi:MAG: hypothetical protein ACRC3J_05320 [Culicoidibacterales bacterium]